MILSNQLNNPQVKKHMLLIILGTSLGVLLYYYFGTSIIIDEKSYTIVELILSICGGVLLAYLTYYISLKLDKLLPWKTQLVNRFISGILILFISSYALVYIIVLGYNGTLRDSELQQEFYESNLIKLAIILFILMLIYNIIYFAIYSYYSYSKLQIEAVAYERKQYDLQLKALKSQLSSHFLFNNLNTVSSLAFSETQQAEDYIRGLAKIYDYTLNSYHAKLVTIKEELEVVKAYLLLLSTRFGEVLKYSIEISDSSLNHKIPPLTLQMLLENAVKHNQVSKENPLKISITEAQNQIIVSNNITKVPTKVSSFNIGLKNINSRFKLIHNKEITISSDKNYTVKIPIIIEDE